MDFKLLRATSPFSQLIFTALIVLICGIAVMLMGFLLGWSVFGIGINEMESALTNLTTERNINFLKVFQALQTIGLFILPPFIVAFFLHNNPRKYLYLDHWPTLKSLILVIAIVFFANPLISWLSAINSQLQFPTWLNGLEDWMRNAENQAGEITDLFLESKSIGGLFTNIFLVAVLPAIGEELLFRGIVQQILKKMTKNSHAAIWISAAIFSALHMQFFGFLPRMVLGAMFGYMLEWTGSLWTPIIAHFINNCSAVLIYYFTEKSKPDGSEQADSFYDGSFILVLLSAMFLYALFRALYAQRIIPQTAELSDEWIYPEPNEDDELEKELK